MVVSKFRSYMVIAICFYLENKDISYEGERLKINLSNFG